MKKIYILIKSKFDYVFNYMSIHLEKLLPFLSKAAVFIALATSCIGIPMQIVENFQKHSVEGLSLGFSFIVFSGYFIWFLYGIAKRDKCIAISQFPGVIFSIILCLQFLIY